MSRFVRRATCTSCGVEVGITRGELRRRIVQCVCGARFALEVRGGEGGLHRAMQQLQPRPLMPGPPTPRIEERLGPVPALLIRQQRGERRGASFLTLAVGLVVLAVAVGLGSIGWAVVAILYLALVAGELWRRERLRIVDGALERPRRFGVDRVPLAEIDAVVVVPCHVEVRRRQGEALRLLDESLGLGDDAREWIAAWIRDAVRRSDAPRDA